MSSSSPLRSLRCGLRRLQAKAAGTFDQGIQELGAVARSVTVIESETKVVVRRGSRPRRAPLYAHMHASAHAHTIVTRTHSGSKVVNVSE